MDSVEKLNSLVEAGRVAAEIHQNVQKMLKPGLNLLEIEKFIDTEIAKNQMKPAFKGYKGYPAASCLSVNSQVVHGIPKDYCLKVGDVVSVDLGVTNNGWIVDTARTHAVGPAKKEVSQLLKTTQRALEKGIEQAKPGRKIGDISAAIQQEIEKDGFFVIRELTGHGTGRKLQEPPTIPNFGRASTGPNLQPGMVLALEPITALKPVNVTVESDDWTVLASPPTITAHFEDTIIVTDNEPIILTKLPSNTSQVKPVKRVD